MIDVGILCGQIRDGQFDDDLDQIGDAVKDRRQERREDVLALVHEVFGDNADIVIKR